MVEPPLDGAVQLATIELEPGVSVRFEGVPGAVRGATEVVHVEATPSPTLFFALTLKMYCVPFVRPVTEAVVALEVPSLNVVHVDPPFVENSMT